MKTGIYSIQNVKNGKRYIGSSYDIKNRWWQHKRQLQQQKHHSFILQRAWNKYGEELFIFEVLLYCDPQDCLTFEQIALDCYQPEYNVCREAGSVAGYRHTASTKRKMSARHQNYSGANNPFYGKRHSEEFKEQRRGSNHPLSKLTQSDVDEILALLTLGTRQHIIAEQFGVAQQTVSNIKNHKRWYYGTKC